MNQQLFAKLVYGADELFLTTLFVGGGEGAPFGPRMIESEIDKLPRQLRFVFFEFNTIRG